jgi:hypothetical protein
MSEKSFQKMWSWKSYNLRSVSNHKTYSFKIQMIEYNIKWKVMFILQIFLKVLLLEENGPFCLEGGLWPFWNQSPLCCNNDHWTISFRDIRHEKIRYILSCDRMWSRFCLFWSSLRPLQLASQFIGSHIFVAFKESN